MTRIASLSILSAALLAACSTAAVAPAKSPATTMNGMLVGPNQMTLYVFDRDAAAGSGKSVCNGGCTALWPPLMAPADASAIGDWSVVMRDDGSRQWAYKGRPLYYWSKDVKPGDMMGDGYFNNNWHTAKP